MTGRRGPIRWSIGLALLIVLPGVVSRGWADEEEDQPAPKWWYFSPIRVQGDVGYGYTRSMAKRTKPESESRTQINVAVAQSVAGYIYKPWMALWDGDIQVGINSFQRVIHTTISDTLKDSDMLNRRLGGNFNLNVLPRSRFPWRGYVQQNHTDSSEGRDNRGSGTIYRRYGFSQSYQTEEGTTQGSLNYEGFRQLIGAKNISGYQGISVPAVDLLEGRSGGDALTMRASTRFENQVLDFIARRIRNQSIQNEGMSRSRDLGAVISHDYVGEDNWNLASVADVTRLWSYTEAFVAPTTVVTVDQNGCQTNTMPYWNDSDFLSHQLSNTFFWRAKDEPFTINASSRYNRTHDWQGSLTQMQRCQNQTANPGLPDPNQPLLPVPQPALAPAGDAGRLMKSSDLRLGMNYFLIPEVSVNSDMNGTFIDTSAKDTRDRFYRGGSSTNLAYDPPGVDLGPFNYRWFGGAGVISAYADGMKPLRLTNQRVGHGVSHNMPLSAITTLNTSVSENFVSIQQHTTPIQYTVNHSGSAQLERTEGRTRSFGNFTLADVRAISQDSTESQSANVQLSHTMDTGEGSSLTGNLTSQINRMVSPATGQDFFLYSFMDINYADSDIFDLPGLRISSSLRFGAPAMFPLGGFAGQEFRSWWNRVDYQVGKIMLSLTATVQENVAPKQLSKMDGMLLFELRRYFDTKF